MDRLTFRCHACGATHAMTPARWRCECGGVLDLDLAPRLDPAELARGPLSMWRYRPVLPLVPGADPVTLDEGLTPLTGVELDGRPFRFKQDHLFPSGSYKDRGAALLISHARALGVSAVVEDSSGNAGSAIAGYCAVAGLGCTIYVPEGTAPAKVAQMEAYGAEVVRVPGSREDTARAVRAAAKHTFYASHVWQPHFFHGTKTAAYEIWEQLGRRAPATVVAPVGNGSLLLGLDMGFRELLQMGLTRRLPRLIGVQSAACAPLHAAFQAGSPIPAPVESRPTMAEGVAIAAPARGIQILRAVRESRGAILAVSEEEIAAALHWSHRHGFYIEPTSAVTVAGARRLPAGDPGWEPPVVILTGHGLKKGVGCSHNPPPGHAV